ncbi:hypothetical protein JGU71_12690 [Antrihabitans sp. YC3-6]|uniref:Uncharacterized protein n=1 Tax=Antrihabitans stalagmiti TaxID=2799499 RepID=A0A934NR33_9NOCA|nr:hypothetical protein [Antrihabitans stalagmiti]MBJ8339745.1 hypothetical protein [Antrihabitans stalagmiti]
MTWSDVHARTFIIETVLERARRNPEHGLQLDGLLEVERLFGGAGGVLLALQHRWNTHLAVKLDFAIEKGAPTQSGWDELAAEQPTLRALLDAYSRRSLALRSARRSEQLMIAEHATGRRPDGNPVLRLTKTIA